MAIHVGPTSCESALRIVIGCGKANLGTESFPVIKAVLKTTEIGAFLLAFGTHDNKAKHLSHGRSQRSKRLGSGGVSSE